MVPLYFPHLGYAGDEVHLIALLFIKLSVAESTTSAAKDEEAQGSKKTRFPVRRRDSETGVVTINLTPSSASRLLEAAEKSKKGGAGGEADGSSSAAKQKVSISKYRKVHSLECSFCDQNLMGHPELFSPKHF